MHCVSQQYANKHERAEMFSDRDHVTMARATNLGDWSLFFFNEVLSIEEHIVLVNVLL